MNRYLALLSAPETGDISALSDRSPPFSRISRFGRAFDALERLCPEHVSLPRWQQCLSDAETFLQQWGEAAHELGWTARDLFELHSPPANPHPSYSRLSRYDHTGLLWLLQGRPVVALTDTAAAIRSRAGVITTYRRTVHRAPADVVPQTPIGGRS
jgi:hypothetical protein